MEDRINSIEKELAMMAITQQAMKNALEQIAATLKELSSIQADTKVLQTKITTMDSELREAFQRVYKRIDDDKHTNEERLNRMDNTITWSVRSIFAAVSSVVIYYLTR